MNLLSYHVYILRCADGSYYAWHTSDRESRFLQHQKRLIEGYTYFRRPVVLVFTEKFATRDDAFRRERQIKGWSTKKKEAVINQDWKLLSMLSKREK